MDTVESLAIKAIAIVEQFLKENGTAEVNTNGIASLKESGANGEVVRPESFCKIEFITPKRNDMPYKVYRGKCKELNNRLWELIKDGDGNITIELEWSPICLDIIGTRVFVSYCSELFLK
jgi:hypothetical protein